MMQHHKYSLTELNEMLPWEREVYVAMLIEYVKEENCLLYTSPSPRD